MILEAKELPAGFQAPKEASLKITYADYFRNLSKKNFIQPPGVGGEVKLPPKGIYVR